MMQSFRHSESSMDKPLANLATSTTASDSSVPAQYIVFTFSNVHILNDDLQLSWYNLHPYELLETHSIGGLSDYHERSWYIMSAPASRRT
jgi:hypothetical protein